MRAVPVWAWLALAGRQTGTALGRSRVIVGAACMCLGGVLFGSAFAMVAAPTIAYAAPPRSLPPGAGSATPSILVATEMAFARMVREKGQWEAFRKFADDAAVVFQPSAIPAKSWLAGQKEPTARIQWSPHAIWMSCDGTLGVSQGGWSRSDGTFGGYTAIWKRQKKGQFRWVAFDLHPLPQPLEATDMLSASVADCAPRGPRNSIDESGENTIIVRDTAGGALAQGGGASGDETLRWSYLVRPDNTRKIIVTQRKSGTLRDVVDIDTAVQGS